MSGTFDFDDAFEALTGYRPFPWQARLFKRLSAGDLPPAVDIPTGLGKTSVMALWLLARAAGARLPCRLVHVVDRRAVVDQATTFAEDIRTALNRPACPAIERVRRGLALGDRPLAISTLRGKYVDNREWLEDPAAPAIIVGTVDMIGSRLLFEGYGVSRRMRPYCSSPRRSRAGCGHGNVAWQETTPCSPSPLTVLQVGNETTFNRTAPARPTAPADASKSSACSAPARCGR